jgi:hypothetical protein
VVGTTSAPPYTSSTDMTGRTPCGEYLRGYPEVDAAAAFARERRRESVARLTSRLTFKDRDAIVLVPLDEVVAVLGRVGERDVGLREIALDSIVGTVDRHSGEFDRRFRPRSYRLQKRWQQIAAARRRGETMPPDRRLPRRRAVLRPGRPPPRFCGPGSRRREDRSPYSGRTDDCVCDRRADAGRSMAGSKRNCHGMRSPAIADFTRSSSEISVAASFRMPRRARVDICGTGLLLRL